MRALRADGDSSWVGRRELPGEKIQKVPGQEGNVLPALPERGQANFHHIEGKEQVFPETSGLHFLFQMVIDGRHHPDISPAALVLSQPLELLLLEKPQELGL